MDIDTIQSDEGLRVCLINYLSETIGDHAILKGGMVLRLLDCPRYTNDLDYVLIPFRSKKDVIAPIEKALKALRNITVDHRLHSTTAQFDVLCRNRHGTFNTQVEVSISETCDSQPLSTGDLALQHHQLPHIVRVMRFDSALAHKLAAWNERRLMRDLYDAYFIHKHLNELPNRQVLKERLQKIAYAKGRKGSVLPKTMTINAFLDLLQVEVSTLTSRMVEQELRDYMDLTQLTGLDQKMKIGLTQLIDACRGK